MGKFSEHLKEYFESIPKEQLDKDWDKIKHLNDIGPDVIEYYKHYKKIFENGILGNKR